MKSKDLGVAKWSTPRRITRRALGEGLDQLVAGEGEILVAQHHQHGQGDPGQAVGVKSGAAGQQRGQSLPVGLGIVGQGGEVERLGVLGVGLAGDSLRDHAAVVLIPLEQILAHPGHHQLVEPLGRPGGDGQKGVGPQREPDGVDGLLGEVVDHVPLEAGVSLGLVGLGGGAVAHEVDADHFPVGVGQEIEPAVVPPGSPGRSG